MTKTVLVVDDEPALRRLLEIVLEDAGFRVAQAQDGAEALDQVRVAPPDVCILDVMMPDVDGWQVLEAVRHDPGTSDLPIVMLTAKGEPRDRLRGWELGCDAYVPKPFDPPDLVQEVLAVMVRSPSERQELRERQATVVRAKLDGHHRTQRRGR